MTRTTYILLWIAFFIAARLLLVQPIVDAIRALKGTP